MVAAIERTDVSLARDRRLGELGRILAGGMLRLQEKKRAVFSTFALELPAETRLSVTRKNEPLSMR